MSASQYANLDRLILEAVSRSTSCPLYARDVATEGRRLAVATGRDEMRIIDGRIQALRRAGRIRHDKMTRTDAGGWRLVEVANG